jgi:hypothetical protein
MNKNYLIASVILFIVGIILSKIPFLPFPMSLIVNVGSMGLKLAAVILFILGLTKTPSKFEELEENYE